MAVLISLNNAPFVGGQEVLYQHNTSVDQHFQIGLATDTGSCSLDSFVFSGFGETWNIISSLPATLTTTVQFVEVEYLSTTPATTDTGTLTVTCDAIPYTVTNFVMTPAEVVFKGFTIEGQPPAGTHDFPNDVLFKGLTVEGTPPIGTFDFYTNLIFKGLTVEGQNPIGTFDFYTNLIFKGVTIEGNVPFRFREKGESICQGIGFVAKNPLNSIPIQLNLPPVENQDCCVEPKVFASSTNNDPFENDKTSVIWIYDNGFSNVDMNLQVWNSSINDFQDIAPLNDSTLGTPYLYGNIVSAEGDNLVGYLIDWNLVLSIHGVGTYRVQTIETTVFGDTINQESESWCLAEYNPNLVKGSVKIEWENSHIICGLNSGSQTFDFGTSIFSGEIRLQDSVFGFDSSSYEREFVRYQNKQQVWTKDVENENYILKTGRMTEALHDYIKNFVLKGDNIRVTDYNQNNARTHVQTRVVFNGEYSPEYTAGSKLSKVELQFTNEFTIERKRC